MLIKPVTKNELLKWTINDQLSHQNLKGFKAVDRMTSDILGFVISSEQQIISLKTQEVSSLTSIGKQLIQVAINQMDRNLPITVKLIPTNFKFISEIISLLESMNFRRENNENGIELLKREATEEKRKGSFHLGASYVYWYNRKYDRTGHLFQDRYKSEAVETDQYLFAVIRYIHQNPLKAGIVKNIEAYPYSSYAEYLGLNDDQYIDKDFILALFHEEKEQALTDFKAYNEMMTDEKFLDISDRRYISDKAAVDMIKKKYKVSSSLELQRFDDEKRTACVQFLLEKGLSARQIVRVTGISRYFIQKV